MLALRVFIMYMVAWTVPANIVLHLGQSRNNAQLDGKMCRNSDLVFQHSSVSLVHCASRCTLDNGCSGYMYNPGKRSCVGCKGNYTAGTTLVSEVNTQYFEVFVEADWWGIGHNFYKLSQQKLTFEEAVEYCQLNGGFVAKIDNGDEAQFIAEALAAFDRNCWIGLTDEGHEGTWTWISDGTEANFTNWNTGGFQPNGDGNCVRTNKVKGYLWGDVSCDVTVSVLCERHW